MNNVIKKHSFFSRWKTLFSFVLLVCLPLLTGCESNRVIVNNLDERDANEIIVFLASHNITATKTPVVSAGAGGAAKVQLYDISVSSDTALEAMSFLNQAGLPRRRSQTLLNLFTGAGLVPSEIEQRIRYENGLGEQIASTIRKMEGVLDADVQLSFPQEDPLNPGQKKGVISASVFVKHNGVLDDPNSHLQSKIKRFVSASVTGLSPDNVTVVGEKARYGEVPLGVQGGLEDEKQYVSIWGIIIGKDSISRFRTIFFTFTALVLILLSLLIWITWKISPLLKSKGGVRELFRLKPVAHEEKEKTEEVKEGAPAEKDKGKEGETHADKDVDQT